MRMAPSIIGTSAGAAAMPFTMIVGGPSDESQPGLGTKHGAGLGPARLRRDRLALCAARAHGPPDRGRHAEPAQPGRWASTRQRRSSSRRAEHFDVVGPGAVYVVDGAQISYSSLSEDHAEGIVTVHDVRLHVLGEGDCYDLTTRRPIVVEPQPSRNPRRSLRRTRRHAADEERNSARPRVRPGRSHTHGAAGHVGDRATREAESPMTALRRVSGAPVKAQP